ncbi:pyruvate kinase [Irregularibacter muris]|uniref:Pyruvate kinase n=1 Tax=Irregularibacter muris TaxID=1796619 RepID=A0AAE3KZF4_9FIRM|nr:pyruvate kinase [Irregularibacter muris]MCR1899160.1 pyruvate kinase [Irregularibacter muris]
MKRTKIVCTLGPASESKDVLMGLVKSGMNVSRLNFSHGSHEEHKRKIDLIKEVREELNTPVAILLDTKGPEVRIKQFETGEIELIEGEKFILTTRDIKGNKDGVAVTFDNLHQEIKEGNKVLIDDGLVQLTVEKIVGPDIHCIVENGGPLKNNKSINLPDVNINLPAITEKDTQDIKFGIRENIDFIAASFIRKAQDILEIRKVLEENDAEDIQIISKIENREGVNNIDEIIEYSDGIMVARGDLGVEIPPEEVPLVQKMIIRKCNKAGKPVITATQMLDSMIRNPRPTRAEVTDVANAIFDGTDAIMLSGETAAGKFPVEAVRTMDRIARKTENSLNYKEMLKTLDPAEISVTDSISHATCTTAQELGASAIITATASGHTARMVSKYRPESPILAFTPDAKVVRRLTLVWGVYPVLIQDFTSTDELFDHSVHRALEEGLVQWGDLVVITAGIPLGIKGTTNLIKVHTIGEVLIQGTGIGKDSVTGKIRIVRNEEDIADFQEGEILVSVSIDIESMPAVKKAAGMILEEGGLTSSGAIVALQMGIPVVVGAEKAIDSLENGQIVTIDSVRGLIYQGIAKVL